MNYKKTIVGLTGLYCSGKSTAQKIFEEYGFYIIDVDKLGHDALNKKQNEIIKYFGTEILYNGKIDRKKLGAIVFKDKNKLAKLNAIVHPTMVQEVKKIINNSKKNRICINAALLFEMKLNELCSYVIIVKSSLCNILKRAKYRDGHGFLKTIRILLKQKVLQLAKNNPSYADIFYINNNSDFTNFKKNLNDILLKKGLI